jgi:hypothetical protein
LEVSNPSHAGADIILAVEEAGGNEQLMILEVVHD